MALLDLLKGFFGGGGEQPQAEPSREQSVAGFFSNPVNWLEVSSSNVHSIAYHEGSAILAVRFLGKGRTSEYWYFAVPPEVYLGMSASASKGRFVWNELRGRYTYQRRR
jgi:hypothetical protein